MHQVAYIAVGLAVVGVFFVLDWLQNRNQPPENQRPYNRWWG